MNGGTLSKWLSDTNMPVSSAFAGVVSEYTSESVGSEHVHPDGWWEIEFTYIYNKIALGDIEFRIDIARDSQFLDMVGIIDSESEKNGWWYEKEVGTFLMLPSTGLPSNYGGRRVRYRSTDEVLLTPTELYYWRVNAF